MASRPGSRRISGASNTNSTEPFPAMPDSPAGPSSPSNHTTTTTTTTTVHGPTVTTTVHRGRPYTITSAQPATQTPTSIVSAPDNNFSPSPAPASTSTRTTYLAPTPVVRARPISIRRLPSGNLRAGYEDGASSSQPPSRAASGRGRSTSAPQSQYLAVPGANNLTRQSTRQSILPTVAENVQSRGTVDRDTMNENVTGVPGRRRSVSNAAQSIISRFSNQSRERQEPEYESEVVDLLDVLGKSKALRSLSQAY